jgi:hypothetical protein
MSARGYLQPAAIAETAGGIVLQTAGQPQIVADTPLWALDERELEPTALAAFETFHRDPGAGVACASCHPEGQDDGRVRTFDGAATFPGPRRSLPLAGGLSARAPFHWHGEHASFDDVIDDTWVVGMQGAPDIDRAGLLAWIDRIPAVRATVRDSAAVERGRELFAAVGCDACHAGPQYTNGAVADVGRGPLKVPSLVGLGTRAPLMHDGCAPDIEYRLTGPAECTGGAAHGDLTALSARDLDALAAFLRSL